MRLLKPLLILFVCAVIGPAIAGPFEDSRDVVDAAISYHRGDYATVLGLLQPRAEKGNAFAQYNLGVMYRDGRGVLQDYATAMMWLRKAADQGVADAQYNLGFAYDTGTEGVPQDYAAAASWYRKAADQGDADGQNNLGTMYEQGQGMPQDYVQAHVWYDLAASRLNASEKEARERAAKNRDAVAAKMTPAQIAEAHNLASAWKPKAEP
jgi:uncharacterized protein